MSDNPHRYGPGWTVEQHRDELIDRLGGAIRRINEMEREVEEVRDAPCPTCPRCGWYTCGHGSDEQASAPAAAPEGAPREGIPTRPQKEPAGSWGGEVYLVRNVDDYVTRVESALRALTEERDKALEALRAAEEGLRTSYNVQDYPGDGTSSQDDALKIVRAVLAKHPAPATPRKDGD